ncbi:HNH endonuclease [Bizionia sp.]|uniref:HNH endonuclease n=1 Tax=Bizionia sp. TaxID=1954480 RepID=UPI003A95C6C2
MIYLKKIFSVNQTINNEIVKRNKADNRRKITTPENGGNNIIYLGTDEDSFFKDSFRDVYDLCEQKHLAQEDYNTTIKKGEGTAVINRVKTSLLKEIVGSVDEYLRVNRSMYHNPNFDYRAVLNQLLRLGEYLEFHSELVFIRDNHNTKPYLKWFEKDGFELFKEFFIADVTLFNIEIFKENDTYVFEWSVSFDPLVLMQLLEDKESEGKLLENTLKNTTITSEQYGRVVERLVKTRVGQSGFRQNLLADPTTAKCPFTEITNPELLIASHIKPWSVSTPAEKADISNGFMFTPSFDLLFDKGFISFTNDKKVIFSSQLDKETFDKVGLTADKETLPTLAVNGRENYLEYHRTKILRT